MITIIICDLCGAQDPQEICLDCKRNLCGACTEKLEFGIVCRDQTDLCAEIFFRLEDEQETT